MDFLNTDIWIFDLDNTLYPPEVNLFSQIEQRMVSFVMREYAVTAEQANRMRRDYWAAYGTTLAGLMAEHDVDPVAYLNEVHDIDFSVLPPAPDLALAIAALPGRKLVHTNGDSTYAGKVLAALGLDGFEAVYGVEETNFIPKPEQEAFASVIQQAGIDPGRAAFFEDDPRNLLVPHSLGMRTVLVGQGRDGPNALAGPGVIGDHVQHQTGDLTDFLRKIVLA